MSNITEIQRLLNEKADLQAQINISAFDGSIEVKGSSKMVVPLELFLLRLVVQAMCLQFQMSWM